ncbi:MAG: MFS transporter [Oscillospiraceae bacterium]|nr:MFS transporter [Oscillospiraceae bacterium]
MDKPVNTAPDRGTPKIVTKDFVLLFAMALMLYTGMNMLTVIVPLFVIEDLGSNTAITGLLSTVYTLAACLTRPVAGNLSDRFPRRAVMVTGCVIFLAASAFCGLVPVLAALFLGRILQGVGYSVASTANNTASLDVIPPSRLGEGIGYFGMSQSVAGAIGPALASVLVGLLGNRCSFYGVAACGLLGVVMALCVNYEKCKKMPRVEKPKEAQSRPGLKNIIEKTALRAALVEFASLFCIVSMMCFATPYLKVSRGFAAWVPGAFFAVSAVVIVLLRLAFSRFVGKCSHLAFLLPAYGSMILLCLGLPHAESAAAVIAMGVLYGAGHGLVWMAMGYEAVRTAPQERKGMANAMFYLAFDAAIGLGAAFWGFLIEYIGYVPSYRIAAVCFVVLAGIMCVVFRKRPASVS